MSSVDREVRAFYQRQELAPDRAMAILEAGRAKRRTRQRRILLAAATAALMIAGAFLLSSALASRALGDRVAAEVAMNHAKDLGVEVAATSYAELGSALDKLPFSLLAPAEKLADHQLVGGRYCSIQAQLSAQLKVREADGRTATLYVTELTPELSALPGTRRRVDGVTIEVWSESGLLYALAH